MKPKSINEAGNSPLRCEGYRKISLRYFHIEDISLPAWEFALRMEEHATTTDRSTELN